MPPEGSITAKETAKPIPLARFMPAPVLRRFAQRYASVSIRYPTCRRKSGPEMGKDARARFFRLYSPLTDAILTMQTTIDGKPSPSSLSSCVKAEPTERVQASPFPKDHRASRNPRSLHSLGVSAIGPPASAPLEEAHLDRFRIRGLWPTGYAGPFFIHPKEFCHG